MAKKCNNKRPNPKTKLFNKGFKQAAKKNDYQVGDLVLDLATVGLWSVGRRALR